MTNSSSRVPPSSADSKPVTKTHHPRPTDPKTEPESSLPRLPDPTEGQEDPSISNGPSMVDTGAHHAPSADFRIVHGADVQDAKYFQRILHSQGVNPLASKNKTGQTVYSSALQIVESLALEHSATVVIFDDAKAVGFGNDAIAWADADDANKVAQVQEYQTRAGAGSALVGFLASAVSSGTAKTISLLTSTTTLPLLLPALAAAPLNGVRLIVNVATTKVDADNLAFTDDFSSVVPHLASVPSDKFAIYLSSTPSAIIMTSAALLAPSSTESAVHFIESTFAGRQVADLTYPSLSETQPVGPVEVHHGQVKNAKQVLILPASHTANSLTHLVSSDVAVVTLNNWSPSSELAELLTSANKSASVTILADSAASVRAIKDLVLASVYSSSSTSTRVPRLPVIKSAVLPATTDSESLAAFLAEHVPSATANGHQSTDKEKKTVSFYTSATHPVPELIAHMFLASPSLSTQIAQFGSSVAQGVKSVLTLTKKDASTKAKKHTDAYAPISVNERSDVVWITEPQIVKQNDIISTLADNALLVLVVPWSEEEVASKLTRAERQTIKDRNVRVFLLPPSNNPIVEQVAFLMLYTSQRKLSRSVSRVLDAFYGGYVPRDLAEEAQAGLTEVEGISEWNAEAEEEEGEEKIKSAWEWDALAGERGVVDVNVDSAPQRGDWSLAARKFMFKEAFEYGTTTPADAAAARIAPEDPTAGVLALRPSLEEKTFVITVSENRRLTPETYDRNVFHIGFDTAGTGLTYEVGEALGIHGWNDEAEVREFMQWYGLDPAQLVSFPSPHDHGKTYETRTVFQLLQQNLDLFGKPSKSFYASLAALASHKNDQRTLRFIAAPEGVALFKKMSEKETVTFADVLKQFKSARPSIEELVGMIPEIKPRHYSIASSQKAVGDKVELLIVTVDWTTPSGSPRFGQCTRYLADLVVGAQVTVSIKPSVMKLPPLDTQPVIMAGLGTGAAPFRAFIQHRAWQREQGIKVGPLVYYFGSRYRSQEYLYGEEIEAYMDAGIITHAGLAFSRDGKDKSYIQHKMKQDKALLSKMLLAEGPDAAYFYLCGPTWPVPDVYEALVSSLVENGGKERKEAEDYIEELKEEERYVLEVY
ncbi:hypothetical protein QFC21_005600 [Naganishia friedmannii]|uniref:Uncharacterized protein n=1 Tax=Naganishia friedmannii TaxID=89922 RepID=A0ACC2V8C7_9TREE|nr:hypothetical protein QFC21_005600 [Naganishia friedmannii]